MAAAQPGFYLFLTHLPLPGPIHLELVQDPGRQPTAPDPSRKRALGPQAPLAPQVGPPGTSPGSRPPAPRGSPAARRPASAACCLGSSGTRSPWTQTAAGPARARGAVREARGDVECAFTGSRLGDGLERCALVWRPAGRHRAVVLRRAWSDSARACALKCALAEAS